MIVHMIFSRGLAGAERSAINLVQALTNQGINAKFFLVFDNRFGTSAECSRFAKALKASGVPYSLFNTNGRLSVKLIKELLAQCPHPPKVIHSHGYKSDVYSLLLLAVFSAKNLFTKAQRTKQLPRLVATLHGYPNAGIISRINECFGNVARLFFSNVVFVSKELAEKSPLMRCKRGCHVVPNFSRLSKSQLNMLERAKQKEIFMNKHRIFTKNPVIGWLGRLESVKGPDLFLEAISCLEEELTVLMAGSGSLVELVKSYVPPKNVHFLYLGEIDNVLEFYSALNLLVMSSRQEGTPMVVLEAIATDVPVLAPRVGGIPDILFHELMTFPAEDVDSLRKKIVQNVFMPVELRQTLMQDTRDAIVASFSEEAALRQFVKIYQV